MCLPRPVAAFRAWPFPLSGSVLGWVPVGGATSLSRLLPLSGFPRGRFRGAACFGSLPGRRGCFLGRLLVVLLMFPFCDSIVHQTGQKTRGFAKGLPYPTRRMIKLQVAFSEPSKAVPQGAAFALLRVCSPAIAYTKGATSIQKHGKITCFACSATSGTLAHLPRIMALDICRAL